MLGEGFGKGFGGFFEEFCYDFAALSVPLLLRFCLCLRLFLDFFRNKFDFLRILSYVAFLLRFFGVSARFFEVLGGSGEGFWEVFSMIFDDFFEVLRK